MPATYWTCPVCHTPLQLTERSYRCENGHSFDLAKEGYVNLLLAHQKSSANPGDDKQMLRNRREFLEQDYYRPLADRLSKLCVELVQQSAAQSFSLLETGCGEGYYTGQISDALGKVITDKPIWIGGIDIAKEAVRMAAKRYKNTHFAVASNASLPVVEQGIDCVVQVFAPGYDEQVVRALKAGGHFISATPGPRHLYGLRQLVYDQPREHDAPVRPVEGLVHESRELIEYPLNIEQKGDVARLLTMTPYYWHVGKDKQQQIAALEELLTEVSFVVDLYRKE